MSVPWHRRVLSDIALTLSAAVPWTVALLFGFIVRPITYVSPSLPRAFDEIDVPWGVVAALVVAIVCGLLAASFAAWRVRRPTSWRWDKPFSLWRTAKWSLALFAMSWTFAGLAPSLLTIRLGKIVPHYYERSASEDLFAPWSYTALAFVLVGLVMFVVDAYMEHLRRGRRVLSA